MTDREAFEQWWKTKYRFEMSRGVRGRGGYQLDQYEGVYISDKVRDAFEVWMAARA